MAETLVATIILGALATGAALMIFGEKPGGRNQRQQNDQCLNLANNILNKLAEGGLPRYPMHFASTTAINPLAQEGWRRSIENDERLPGINPNHQIPGGSGYSLIEKPTGAPAPVALRNALLATGALGTVQAIYNSNPQFCSNTNPLGTAYTYTATSPGQYPDNTTGAVIKPLVPAEISDVKWRGLLVGGRTDINVTGGVRIQPYSINTGQVLACIAPPLILQPQATSEPPPAYDGVIATRGSGVRNDIGFLVTVTINYNNPDNLQGAPLGCSVERKFQHQRMAPTAAATPFSVETANDDAVPTCATLPTLASVHGNFTVDLKYNSRDEARGSVLLCRDRSLRLKPLPLSRDTETALRTTAPATMSDIENCITTGNLSGGLSTVTPGVVTNCFVRRRAPSADLADFYQATVPAEYAISRMGPTDANEPFVACEDLQICRINGVGSRPMAASFRRNPNENNNINDDEVVFTLQFNLSKNQAGCHVHIETAQVDVAGNVRRGEYRQAFMSSGSPGAVADGYCIDGNGSPLAAGTAYANCFAPLTGMGDGNCPCYADRYRPAGTCVDVGDGYYSEDDNVTDDVNRVACTNGPGNATPTTAASFNFTYRSSGNGNNTCAWDCLPGYNKVVAPPSCVPTAAPTPPPCTDGTGNWSANAPANQAIPTSARTSKDCQLWTTPDYNNTLDFFRSHGATQGELDAFIASEDGFVVARPQETGNISSTAGRISWMIDYFIDWNGPLPEICQRQFSATMNCSGAPPSTPPPATPCAATWQLVGTSSNTENGDGTGDCTGPLTSTISCGIPSIAVGRACTPPASCTKNTKCISFDYTCSCTALPTPTATPPVSFDPCFEQGIGVGCFTSSGPPYLGTPTPDGQWGCGACQPMPPMCGTQDCRYVGNGDLLRAVNAPYDTLAECQSQLRQAKQDECFQCTQSGLGKYQYYENRGNQQCDL